jgi:hypothetical protein
MLLPASPPFLVATRTCTGTESPKGVARGMFSWYEDDPKQNQVILFCCSLAIRAIRYENDPILHREVD